MPLVLTEKSEFQCGHGMTFKLAKKGSAVMTVDGVPCLTTDDLEGAVIAGTCGAPPSSTVKPCVSILSVIVGAPPVLCASGAAAVDETVTGLTDGLVGGAPVTYMVSVAAQRILEQR